MWKAHPFATPQCSRAPTSSKSPYLSSLRPPTTLLPPLLLTLPATFLLSPSSPRPPCHTPCTPSLPHPLRQALSEAEKEKFMYPCDPWETCTPQLFDDTAAAAPAATAGLSVAAASAAATAGLSTPAPVLAPVLQGANGPSAKQQGSLEYSIKLKEYEIQLQQLRILRSQLQEAAAAQCTPPKDAPAVAAEAPSTVPIHMYPAPGTTPMHMRGRATSAPDVTAPSIHVFAVPTGAGYPPTSPSSLPDSTVPSYGTFSQGFDATPSFPPGTAPSHDASAPSFPPTSKMFSPSFILPTSPSYGPDSPISSQTTPSCSRTASPNPLEPSCSSPSFAFASEAPPLSFFDGAATPDPPSLVPTISPLTIPDLMPAELEELLTDALEQMTEDQARASSN